MADQKQTKRQKLYTKLKEETPEGFPVPATKLRFPVIPPEIEYLDVIQKKVTIKSYKSEIAGLSWREVNEKLFTDGVPAGKYSYAMKFFKNTAIYRGFIKSVDPRGERVPAADQNESIKAIKQTIDSLKDSLRSDSQKNLGIDYILQATQRSHDAEISIYKLEIAGLKEKIAELKQEIIQLDLQLDKAEQIIIDFKESGSNNKLTETLLGLFGQITGKQTIPDLKRKD